MHIQLAATGKHLYHNLQPLMQLVLEQERVYYCSLDYLEKASIVL